MNKRYYLIIISTFLFLYGCQSTWSQSKMRKGPYLIYTGNNTEMKVLWQLDSTLNCTLEWGTDLTYQLGNTITTETGSGVNEHQHIYTITGLTANTKYHYRVTENGVQHAGSFLSAPADTTTCITFYAYGDTRSYPDKHNDVCGQILNNINTDIFNQSFLMHTGDWNSSDSETYWDNEYFNRNYSNILSLQASIPIMGARGNHESSATYYKKYWQYDSLACYYSFDYGPVHFTVIDQYVSYSTTSSQYAWIESDLANTNKEWKIIVLHEPGYTDESNHNNNQTVQTYLEPLFIQYGIHAVFAGHNHFYAHCLVNGIHHLTLGGGGGPLYTPSGIGTGLLYSESTLHFAKFTVCNGSILTEIIRDDGTIADTFSISLTGIKTKGKKDAHEINVYPNPGKNLIYFDIGELQSEIIKVEIVKSTGEIVFTQIYKNTIKGQIETNTFTSGLYTVYISGKSFSASKKVVLE